MGTLLSSRMRGAAEPGGEVCALCEGLGMRIVEKPGGSRHAEPCTCRREARGQRVIAQAHIPRRYEHCTMESYEWSFAGANPSLRRAFGAARKFIDGYPLEMDGMGLLFTGSIGVGKTHLAVGMLQSLITERGGSGLFYDYRELLKQVQNSYNPRVAATELEVLAPVFNAEVLVLDEIGASKPTDWVWDTVAHILNTRYNDRRTTILTTNFPNRPSLRSGSGETLKKPDGTSDTSDTLGDRITDRMWSRLQEMCVVVDMLGEDFRLKVKRAAFV